MKIENSLTRLFDRKSSQLLNIYFTAGFPQLHDTKDIVLTLQDEGVDIVEVGVPYSDPLADGPTIQGSSSIALQNGMTLTLLFQQLEAIKSRVRIPIILMGYYNQMMQFGIEKFLSSCQISGVSGLIIPDLPMDIYERELNFLFQKYQLSISFLITPETSEERIKRAERLSTGFIYVVSQSSITGNSGDISQQQEDYFQHISSLGLTTPTLIGFGIHNRQSYLRATNYSNGAIIGSAFIRALDKPGKLRDHIGNFINTIR